MAAAELAEGFEFKTLVCCVSAEDQAEKLACCDIDPALYGAIADITQFAGDAILAAPASGVSINGNVHVAQGFKLIEPIRLGETLTMRGRVTQTTPDPRGTMVLSEFSYAREDGSVPLTATRLSLKLDAAKAAAHSRRSHAAASKDPSQGRRQLARWQLVPDKVARYSKAGQNLIHSDPETARRFGFRAPIAGGLMAVRVIMAALAAHGAPTALDMSVRFRRPMFWDEALDLYAAPGVGDAIEDLMLINGAGKVAVEAKVQSLAYAA